MIFFMQGLLRKFSVVIAVYTEDEEEMVIPDDFSPTENLENDWKVVNKLSYGHTERACKLENSYMSYSASFEVNDTWYHSGQKRPIHWQFV
jgi:hypothetical protein